MSDDSMRSGWNRATAVLDLTSDVVESLVGKAIPDAKVVRFVAVEGGLANTNFKVELEHDGRVLNVLLKIFVRDPNSAPKEFALNKLVCNKVPTPRFLHFWPAPVSELSANSGCAERLCDADSQIEYPYAVIEWVEGSMLLSVFPTLSEEQRYDLGVSIGSALATIHSFKFSRFGFLDHELNVQKPITMDGAGLVSYVRQCLIDGPGGERIGFELTNELIRFVEREGKLLDSWNGEPCLTHSDFNHSNILVAASAEQFQVAAVLDWEFAFSGTPFFDFGNLLRAPVGLSKSFVPGVEYGYRQAGGTLPAEWRRMSLLTDLTAWTEFLTRENINDNLIADAIKIIRATIESSQ